MPVESRPTRERLEREVAELRNANRALQVSERQAGRAARRLKTLEAILSRTLLPWNRQSTRKRYAPPYGDLTGLNECRVIADSVGENLLSDIVTSYLGLLETSAAVYEKNGDYALGIFSSGWCKLLDAASRASCGVDDNREALQCGRWACHESCWNDASRIAIETNQPVDIPCAGCGRIYAIPIRCGEEIVGSANFGYGDPPTDRRTLRQLSDRFQIPLADLQEVSAEYEHRPPLVIELAKDRLALAANLIGQVVARRRAEQKVVAQTEKIQRAQKTESLVTLAGGVAHDFNNILAIILGYADLARADLPPESPVGECLEEIGRAGRRATELSNQMLAYSGRGAVTTEAIDLNALVMDLQALTEIAVSRRVSVSYRLAESLPRVRASAAQIRQLILNLMTNAAEAIGDQAGSISIGTGVREPEKAPHDSDGAGGSRGPGGNAEEGAYAVLEIVDTGCGMDAETVEKIFDPFFTTKFVGRGLGLSAVQGIAHGHGGKLEVRSSPGRGTAIRLLLPLALDVAVQPEPQLETPAERRAGGMILLVDDEPGIRATASRVLERAGFEVRNAADGREAVEIFGDHPDAFACVILDLTMPHSSGVEAYRGLMAIRPEVAVVVSSGYAERDVASRFGADAPVNFLQKPYRAKALVEIVLRAVERGSHTRIRSEGEPTRPGMV